LNLFENDDDEYAGLKVNQGSSLSTRVSTGKYNNLTILNVNIYFNRKNVKLKVEIWKFIIFYNNTISDKLTFRKTLLYKKLSVFIRSIYSLTKLLPAFSFYITEGFDFEFDFDISLDKNFSKDMENSNIKNTNFEVMKLINFSDNFGVINLEIFFLSKNKIFKLEEEMVIYNIILEKKYFNRRKFKKEAKIFI
jgi:hypothetical protein